MSKVSKTRNVRRSKYQIFPPLLSDRHEALEKSFVAHGVETATTCDSEGNLLDGWERERICEGRWPDVLRVNSKEKEWHPWQQPLEEVERLVRYFSGPGDLVVDPCGGGFTIAEACLRLSRRCVSCDVSADCVSKGLERMEASRKRLTVGA